MKKVSNRALAIIFGALLVISIAWFAVMRLAPQEKLIAEISMDGKLLYTIDLNKVTQSYTINLPHNTVLVEHGKISMHDADCPDKLCIKQGPISNGTFPIVCLPNKVIIRITDKSGVDVVAGR
jgi:hypothetical protein